MKQAKRACAPAGLSETQRTCLDAIEIHAAKKRTMPSLDELRLILGYSSKSGVLRLLRQLEERGHIARLPNRARSIRLLAAATCSRCGERLQSSAEMP